MEGELRFDKNSSQINRRPPTDLCLAYCEENGIIPKAHCLNYDVMAPNWLVNEVDFTKRKLNKRFHELAERYAHQIYGWEVTKETMCIEKKKAFFLKPDIVEWSFKQWRVFRSLLPF